MIRERVSAGIARAKRQGTKFGARSGAGAARGDVSAIRTRRTEGGGILIAAALKVSTTTVQKVPAAA
jgi:DNA invertase Pin-like site-specific DNA recombinase